MRSTAKLRKIEKVRLCSYRKGLKQSVAVRKKLGISTELDRLINEFLAKLAKEADIAVIAKNQFRVFMESFYGKSGF